MEGNLHTGNRGAGNAREVEGKVTIKIRSNRLGVGLS